MNPRTILCDECKLLAKPRLARDCSGCKKLKAQRWYQAHKEKYSFWRKKWRAENADYNRQQKRAYAKRCRIEHREELNEAFKQWKKNNPEKAYAIQQRWKAKHRDRYLAGRANWYARKHYGEYAEAIWTLRQLSLEIKEKKDGQKTQLRSIKKRAVGNHRSPKNT